MKDNFNYCVTECPYCHDVAACLSGEVCPLKKTKRERIKKICQALGQSFGICGKYALLFHLPCAMFWFPLCFLCSWHDLTCKQ